MQLETPGGNHCCLIHVLILSTVYEHDKQKTIVNKSDQFKMEESKQYETFYCHT